MSEKSKLAKAVFEELTSDGALRYIPLSTSMSGSEYAEFKGRAEQKMLKRIQKAIDKHDSASRCSGS